MLNWDWFSYFALVAVLCWIAGAWSAFKGVVCAHVRVRC